MKKLFLVAALLLAATKGYAYITISGVDPSVTPDAEYKSAQKSTTAGVSDAISQGDILSYDYANNAAGGYIVTRVGGGVGAPEGASLIAGVAQKAVATGDTGYFLIQVRGYATVNYDATNPITRGLPVCASSTGKAMRCSGVAASASKVIALETKSSGTGTDLKVLLNSQ